MSAPGQSKLLGRFSFEASTAIIMEEQHVLNFANVTSACNSNNLNFSGFSLIRVTCMLIGMIYCIDIINCNQLQVRDNLVIVMRSVRASITTVGMMTYTIAVLCQPFGICDVRTTMKECSLDKIEAAFVNMEDSKKGSYITSMQTDKDQT